MSHRGIVTSAPPPEPTETPAPPIRLRDGVRDALLVFVGVRILLFVISAVAGEGLLPLPTGQPPTDAAFPPPSLESGWHVLFTGTQRQDALWYLRLATAGYEAEGPSAAFFPLYPFLIRIVGWLPGVGPLGSALLVSNGALLAALVVLHGLTRREFGADPATARRAIRYLALFPTAFFFLAPYTESVFLLCSLLAFWWARQDRWGLAAVAGILAALTRSVGVLLAVGLAVEAVQQWRSDGRPLVPKLGAAAAVWLGPLSWLTWWELRFGDFLAPLAAQRNWSRAGGTPWETLVDAVGHAYRFRGYWLLDLLVVTLAIVGVALAIGKIRAGYLTYAGASLLLPLFAPFPDRPLLSVPRFSVVIFPLAWGYAEAVARERLPDALVTAGFAMGFALMATLFVAWQYVF